MSRGSRALVHATAPCAEYVPAADFAFWCVFTVHATRADGLAPSHGVYAHSPPTHPSGPRGRTHEAPGARVLSLRLAWAHIPLNDIASEPGVGWPSACILECGHDTSVVWREPECSRLRDAHRSCYRLTCERQSMITHSGMRRAPLSPSFSYAPVLLRLSTLDRPLLSLPMRSDVQNGLLCQYYVWVAVSQHLRCGGERGVCANARVGDYICCRCSNSSLTWAGYRSRASSTGAFTCAAPHRRPPHGHRSATRVLSV